MLLRSVNGQFLIPFSPVIGRLLSITCIVDHWVIDTRSGESLYVDQSVKVRRGGGMKIRKREGDGKRSAESEAICEWVRVLSLASSGSPPPLFRRRARWCSGRGLVVVCGQCKKCGSTRFHSL